MNKSQKSLCLLFAFFACFFVFLPVPVASYTFYVGDIDGWVTNPSKPYGQWAATWTFLVNDHLVFRYKKRSDSVLVVDKDDYENCNTKKPLKSMTGGSSRFRLDKTGAYYFISGNEDHCRKGQKVKVVAKETASSSSPAHSPTPSKSPAISSPKSQPAYSPSPSASPPESNPAGGPIFQSPNAADVAPEAPTPAASSAWINATPSTTLMLLLFVASHLAITVVTGVGH